jgi:hypothetical protein
MSVPKKCSKDGGRFEAPTSWDQFPAIKPRDENKAIMK